MQNQTFFKKTAKAQYPKFLYFGCSDARIAANQLLGLAPGEVFVHRNLGNCVPAGDLNSLSVLEFALDGLGIQHVIVGGHYDCGAVKAAMRNHDHGLMENWFRNIRDVYRLHKDTIDALTDPEAKHRKLVELNVMEQCVNLYKTSVVQRKRKELSENGNDIYPQVHAIVFDPATGLMKELPLGEYYEKTMGEVNHIYSLYDL